jgi:RHH-type rel operon transcriptional repressor/antitoxin RelB
MLGVRLDTKMEKRLERLAKRTGRTKSYYMRKALEEMIEDFEDVAAAMERLENPGKRVSMEDMRKRLAVDH